MTSCSAGSASPITRWGCRASSGALSRPNGSRAPVRGACRMAGLRGAFSADRNVWSHARVNPPWVGAHAGADARS